MSVTMTKGEGVTVFTMKTNPKSYWPPICQILGGLCYSPTCCSVTERLRRVQSTSQSALGAMQIMVGLLNIGLGAILNTSGGGSWYQMDEYAYPYWLGALFIVFGIMCILSEKFPSPCLVIVNVLFNLAGVGFAIAAIVLYSINLAMIGMYWLCERDYDYGGWYERRERPTQAPTPSDEQRSMMEKCLEGKAIILMLLRSINIVLIVVSVLQLCLVISSAVLGIKTLRKNGKEVSKSIDDLEHYKPLLEEVTTNPIA
ncbi:transmembrane protein 176A-like [Centroberyx affinis]|uniref:transmembrane protein 176A-like n=1 Tax=Centroberyx affinis TaxID=166261 RepID=UPI003A5BA6F3